MHPIFMLREAKWLSQGHQVSWWLRCRARLEPRFSAGAQTTWAPPKFLLEGTRLHQQLDNTVPSEHPRAPLIQEQLFWKKKWRQPAASTEGSQPCYVLPKSEPTAAVTSSAASPNGFVSSNTQFGMANSIAFSCSESRRWTRGCFIKSLQSLFGPSLN